MCELSMKCPLSAEGENFKLLDFSKSFRKWRKSSYFDIRKTQIQSSVIWMKNVKKCELSKKCPLVRRGWKLQMFRFFKKFSKMKKIIIFWHQENSNTKFCHSDEKCEKVWIKQNMSTGLRWKQTNLFDSFKSFRKWRKSSYFHARTSEI